MNNLEACGYLIFSIVAHIGDVGIYLRGILLYFYKDICEYYMQIKGLFYILFHIGRSG